MRLLHSLNRSLRLDLWPWLWAGASGAAVAAAFGLARGEYHGISGFSSTNFGWLVFTLVGGIVYGVRQADGRLLPLGLLRPLRAGALAFALCIAAVCVTGLVFLPEQPLWTTLTTDAVGRAWVMAVPVVAVACAVELGKALRRRFAGTP
ncbi:hypothetical protein [Glycomyces paridis]|uniref:Uncharacterized protein n=1 Tax=Glycomyces paridis TaxID=2126555 RepID=A0A4S8PRG2_9ACTN|nr:hypothetical protein [Glycomyces paridis]THV32172.1 hypothetical protein E9998_01635 [Glycomyces paridis]